MIVNNLRQAYIVVKLEIEQEIQTRFSFLSVLLYVFALSYFVYFLLYVQGGLIHMESKYWNVIFWILVLFSIINIVLTHFSQSSYGLSLYYYTLFKPEGFLMGKMIFFNLYAWIVTILLYLIFSLWVGNPVENYGLFFLILGLGSSSFTILFTLTTSISQHLSNRAILSTLLGLPLAIPLVTLLSKLCREAFFVQVSDNFWNNFVILIGFNVIMIVLSLILYPYIWRE